MTRTLPALVLCFVVGAAAGSAADSYPKSSALDILHYRFELDLRDGEKAIEGRAEITVAVVENGVDAIALDFVDAASVEDGGMNVRSVRLDGAETRFEHSDARLLIPLPSAPGAGGRLRIEIDYAGVPADALGIGPNKHGTWSWFSDNWPNKARHWLPTVDHPYDKATSEMIVTAPAEYQVVSNGRLLEETDLGNGSRRTHWRQSVPIATWLYTLGVTRFAVQQLLPFEGKPVQTWVFAEDRDAGFHDFAEPTHHVLEFFSDRIGPYSYEKLANVQSARTRGGMEAATAIMYDDRSVTGERSERWRNVVVHEIAHQWWGNAVTEADWDDVWLSEGFATYFTLLFIEHAEGRDAFVEGLEESRDFVLEYAVEHPEETIVHDGLDDMSRVTTRNTYQKGAWVLHMLRSLVGDDVFWRGIREHYRRYRDANCTTDDFRRTMEEASGRDLGGFFEQWLERGGVPELEWSWSHSAERGLVEVVVEQRQGSEAPYLLRLPVELRFADAEPRREVLQIDRSRQSFEIRVPARPTSVELDPEVQVLVRVTADSERP